MGPSEAESRPAEAESGIRSTRILSAGIARSGSIGCAKVSVILMESLRTASVNRGGRVSRRNAQTSPTRDEVAPTRTESQASLASRIELRFTSAVTVTRNSPVGRGPIRKVPVESATERYTSESGSSIASTSALGMKRRAAQSTARPSIDRVGSVPPVAKVITCDTFTVLRPPSERSRSPGASSIR